jgi:hypothetical protein
MGFREKDFDIKRKIMVRSNQEEGRYRVLLIGIGDNTDEEKDSFCHHISKNYSIPFPVLKKIVDRCPIILKKNLSFKKAEILAKTLNFFGATVSVEEKKNFPPILLEFQELIPQQLALESSYLQKTERGAWSVIGRAKNISDETLNDTWVLVQIFEDPDQFTTYEESPLPINPLPSGEASPFKVVFEGDVSIKKILVAFKNASGQPIPAVDKRKKREWVEVEISRAFEESPQAVDLTESTIPTPPLSLEEEVGRFPDGEIEGEQGGDVEGISEESLSLTHEENTSEVAFEPPGEDLELSSDLLLKNRNQEGEELKKAFEEDAIQGFTPPVPEEVGQGIEKEAALVEFEPPPEDKEVGEGSHLPPSVFEEATQLFEDISETSGVRRGEEEIEAREEEVTKEEVTKEEVTKEEVTKEEDLPWIEYFRDAVKTFYKKGRDIFSIWFEECRKEDEFRDSFHALLIILVHSRFDQGNQSIKALENTQRVSRLLVQRNLLIDEVPPLEGTSFVSAEVWRGLFHRALPKVQHIGNTILEKNRWNAVDLERLIQVIPHMSHQNSRMAIRWINELVSDILEVDFSGTPITIGEDLYRVACRLGIVDPHFDYYQGKNSMGDIKIQSFAKMAFPENPGEVEEPMSWVGRGEERGGHCFPIQPRCDGCLFENFCPKLHPHFNPSEKGMRG